MLKRNDIAQTWTEMNWFAVQAKAQRESLAFASVAKLDLEVFLPMIRQDQLVCGVERRVSKPLFRGYFFAKFSPAVMFDEVRYSRGVLRIVGSASAPVPVDAEVIAAIQARVQDDGFIQLKPAAFQAGDRVTIEEGPLAGWMGQVEREWNDGKRVMIFLEAIQQARVLIANRWLVAEQTN